MSNGKVVLMLTIGLSTGCLLLSYNLNQYKEKLINETKELYDQMNQMNRQEEKERMKSVDLPHSNK